MLFFSSDLRFLTHQDQLAAYNEAKVKLQAKPAGNTKPFIIDMNRKIGEGYNPGSDQLSSNFVIVAFDKKKNIVTMYPEVKDNGY